MKKTMLKKRVIGIGTLAVMTIPVVVAVSCSKDKEDKDLKAWREAVAGHEFTHQNDRFDLTNITKVEATIVSWIDGDTPVVELKKEIKGAKKWNIRISAIDTPELHYRKEDGNSSETIGDEYTWAKKAKDFGDKVLPAGTKIQIVTSSTKSYNRLVGSIFYKEKETDSEKQYKSYSVEILNAGLSLAFMEASKVNVGGVESMIGLAVADAYNNAFKNKRGLFSVDYKSILKVHGVTDDTALRWRGSKKSDTPNIYDMLNISQGDK